MVVSLLVEVTVHEGRRGLGYLLVCLRHIDLQIPLYRRQFHRVDPPVDDGIAVGTDPDEAAERRRRRLVVGESSGRTPRHPTANAVNLTRLTRPLTPSAATFEILP
jgi:hypothetical protein